jgi:archaellum component FlaG (FlaF/FlaG flagellin family)
MVNKNTKVLAAVSMSMLVFWVVALMLCGLVLTSLHDVTTQKTNMDKKH